MAPRPGHPGAAWARCAVGVAAAAVALAGPPGRAAETDPAPRLLASNGVAVPTPDIAELDCAGKAEALRRIDQSNYRGPEPVPADHPDRAIFDYENRLAQRYYTDCLLRAHALDDPGAAFTFGFAAPATME